MTQDVYNSPFDLVIKNGTVVTAHASFCADVAIRGRRIAAVGERLNGLKELDATGLLVTPGAVDVHVHLNMSIGEGIYSADDWFTGTRAAALGGTTTVIDFVDAKPDEPLLHALTMRKVEADVNSAIDYGLHMTIAPGDIPKLDQLQAVYDAGCASFKLYMAYGFRLTDDQLWQALAAIQQVGGLPVVHAENWDVICTLIEQNLAAGNVSPEWHPRSRPAIMEGEAAGRVIDMATYLNVPLYVFHVSCGQVVERIAQARSKGLPIYGETCPQYLFLTDQAYSRPDVLGALPVCSPPLREQEHQDRLWQALVRNELQAVSTDHCPFTQAEKAKGLENYKLIPGGVPSIESRFSLLYSRGVMGGLFTLERWVDLCCTTPARLFGLQKKGEIAPGYDADLVLFDPNAQKRLSTETLHERVDWTPYEGVVVNGWPSMTISRGELLVENGRFMGARGRGEFVVRNLF
ncbi:MAG: dihydropyrimidinase [Chloroflexota bacterium]